MLALAYIQILVILKMLTQVTNLKLIYVILKFKRSISLFNQPFSPTIDY